jgi:antitoxin VapB
MTERCVAKVAKLFINGGSQAVRLPAEFRFSGDEVYVRRDPLTGDVVLSSKPDTWADFFALRDAVAPPPDVLAERPWNDETALRDPFADGADPAPS